MFFVCICTLYRQKSDQPVLNLKPSLRVYSIVESEYFIPHLVLFRPNLCIPKLYLKWPNGACFIGKNSTEA
jgi:hypothetical protein